MRAAIGCRDHSGWAVMVVVGGDPAAPSVLTRERVVLVDENVRMPYHLAAERSLADGRALIRRVERAACKGASRALHDIVDDARRRGHDIEGVAVAAGTSAVPDDLARVLASHALLHAAEGELYREALTTAATSLALATTRFPTKHAISDAAAALGVGTDALDGRLKALGKPLGPPWQKDHREAAAAALLVLVG